MQPRRRDFLAHSGCLAAASTGMLNPVSALASSAGHRHTVADDEGMGVLVDLAQCIGCRLCEYACKQANGIDPGSLASYDDRSVCDRPRRPGPDEFTVVNAYTIGADGTATSATTSTTTAASTLPTTVYSKFNCMHCLDPACVSACIVGALVREESGAVTYDAWKCIGCRYCMVACPFGLPAYSYADALTPEVRKCQFCIDRTREGESPACVAACPQQAMTFRKRRDLLEVAHQKINAQPARYVNHVYGEHEVGGTAWMYVSPVPFAQAGFLELGTVAPPRLTEAIQHGVFKYWIAPIGWYSFLSLTMWFTARRARLARRGNNGHAPRDEQPHDVDDHHGTVAPRPLPSLVPARIGYHASPLPLPHHDDAAPVPRRLLTPGTWLLIVMVLTGVGFGLFRFIFGLAASTNLDQQYPWGLWIAMDVGSGIALAGGGFVTAALVHIFHREHYHAVARSALLTALLGYTFYVPGLLADIGRWYNIWHPTLPNMWQVNSVLFEVGICVMLYLSVQYAEMAPIVCQRLSTEHRWPRLQRGAIFAHRWLEWIMPALLVAGVTLSTFHQSSLGNLMVIAPYKLHALWWTPLSPLLFLVSAMMVGFPMVIFTILFASWSLRRVPPMRVLAPLSLYVPVFLVTYLGLKISDVIWRGVSPQVWSDAYHGSLWLGEMIPGVLLPLIMLLIPRVRRSPGLLAATCLMVILGVVLNRLNCFVLAYHPPYAEHRYFPSITEFAVSMGLVAALMLSYRVAVTYLPILPRQKAQAMP